MEQKAQRGELQISLFSFGFKYGLPDEANLVLDVRFLPNPYWQDHLRPFTGLEDSVADYVLQSESGKRMLEHLVPFIKLLIAEYREADKEHLRIAIGCTGGQHRSVSVVAAVCDELCDAGFAVTAGHRDIGKE